MHELSVTESILKIAIDAANGRRITAIHLRIGDLAGFVDDSVQFYFDLLGQGTTAEGAQLHFDRQRAAATCRACGHTFPTQLPLPQACPRCGDGPLAVSGGRELQVVSIEVAEEDDEDTP